MDIKKKKRGPTSKIGVAILLLLIIFLVVYMVTVLLGSSSFFTESAEKNAILCFEEDINRANALADAHFDNLYEIAEKAKTKESRAEVEELIASYIGSEQFGDLRYYLGNEAYAANGMLVVEETSGHEYISALIASDVRGATPVYKDKHTELDCLAFFLPVRGSEFIDGILSIVPARNIISVGDVINEKASAVAIIDTDGTVFSDTVADGFFNGVGNNFFDFVDSVTNDKSDSNALSEIISENKKSAYSISSPEGNYVVAAAPLSSFGGHLMLVSMSITEGLIAPELTYIRHIVNLLAVSIIALIIGAVYAMLYHKKTSLALSIATLVDIKIECPNAEQFRLTAKEQVSSLKRKY